MRQKLNLMVNERVSKILWLSANVIPDRKIALFCRGYSSFYFSSSSSTLKD
jgi:hypothetical protein